MSANNAHIQSLIAGAIMDVNELPSLKAYLNQKQDVTSADAVLKFSAFICKVKHNFLWESFPLTFKLIHDLKLDIEIFINFLPDYQKSRKEKGLDTPAKTRLFLDFLISYLEIKKQKPFRILYTALQYEMAMRELNDFKDVVSPLPKRRKPVSDQTSIHINGKLFIAQLFAETENIERWREAPETIKVARSLSRVMYWRALPGADIRILKLNKESANILMFLKSGMSISEWIYAGEKKRSTDTVLELLHFLIENQIVQLY